MNKSLSRLIVWTQLFTLVFLMIMPAIIRWLGDGWGKTLYGIMVVGSIGFALALRYALNSLH